MEELVSEYQNLKSSIAEKLASVANESVSQFFDKSGRVNMSKVPLFTLVHALKGEARGGAVKALRLRFPWTSAVNLALTEFRLRRESKRAGVSGDVLLSEVIEDFGLIEGSLAAIHEITVERHPLESQPIFMKILNNLDPFSLNELEKYLRWKGGPQAEQQLALTDAAWRNHCVRNELNVLRNQDSEGKRLYPWKAYYITRHYKRIMKEKKGRDTLQMMTVLTLLYDNQSAIQHSKLLELADLEADTR